MKAHTQKGHSFLACGQGILLVDCCVKKTNLLKLIVDLFVSAFK